MIWANQTFAFDSAANSGNQIVVTAWENETYKHLAGLDPSSGSIVWDTLLDPLVNDGGPFASEHSWSMPAISNEGVIVLLAWFDYREGPGAEALAFDSSGSLLWTLPIPGAAGENQSEFPRDPIFGPDGNLYVTDDASLDDAGILLGSLLWSATPSGTVLLTGVTSRTIGPLAAGTDFIVGQGFGAIALDGGTVFELPGPAEVPVLYCADSQLVDAAGDAIWSGGMPGDAGIGGIFELSPESEVICSRA